MIDFNIISSSSKGNAVVINRTILVDCGVPFRALKDVYKSLQLVLLTHRHGDHCNLATIRKLAQDRPSLRFGCGRWLVTDIVSCGVYMGNVDVYDMNEEFIYNTFSVTPFMLTHNVDNCGYKIAVGDYWKPEKILYATDTNNMNGVEAKGYDLYMLEANYTEAEITERIRAKQEAGEYCHEWDVLRNHLSKEKADNWLYSNMGPNSRYMYMHQHEHADRPSEVIA